MSEQWYIWNCFVWDDAAEYGRMRRKCLSRKIKENVAVTETFSLLFCIFFFSAMCVSTIRWVDRKQKSDGDKIENIPRQWMSDLCI